MLDRLPRRARLGVVAILAIAAPVAAVSAVDVGPHAVASETRLSSTAAAKMLAAAEREALRRGVGVSISIIDGSGNLLREARMDGSSPLLIAYARRKAETSLLFGASTSDLAKDPGMARMVGQVPNLMLVPGGLPVTYKGRPIGAIGISGAAPADDAAIAEVGLGAIAEGDET